MEAISSCEISLSPEEREIVTGLLDRERTNLPVEIHHTRTAKFREQLRHRLAVVESLLTRIDPGAVRTR